MTEITGFSNFDRFSNRVMRHTIRGVNLGLSLGIAINGNENNTIQRAVGIPVGLMAAATFGIKGGMFGIAHASINSLGNFLKRNNNLDKNPLFFLEDKSHQKLGDTLKAVVVEKFKFFITGEASELERVQKELNDIKCLSVANTKKQIKEALKDNGTIKGNDLNNDIEKAITDFAKEKLDTVLNKIEIGRNHAEIFPKIIRE
jgi:hypothetical protein